MDTFCCWTFFLYFFFIFRSLPFFLSLTHQSRFDCLLPYGSLAVSSSSRAFGHWILYSLLTFCMWCNELQGAIQVQGHGSFLWYPDTEDPFWWVEAWTSDVEKVRQGLPVPFYLLVPGYTCLVECLLGSRKTHHSAKHTVDFDGTGYRVS